MPGLHAWSNDFQDLLFRLLYYVFNHSRGHILHHPDYRNTMDRSMLIPSRYLLGGIPTPPPPLKNP